MEVLHVKQDLLISKLKGHSILRWLSVNSTTPRLGFISLIMTSYPMWMILLSQSRISRTSIPEYMTVLSLPLMEGVKMLKEEIFHQRGEDAGPKRRTRVVCMESIRFYNRCIINLYGVQPPDFTEAFNCLILLWYLTILLSNKGGFVYHYQEMDIYYYNTLSYMNRGIVFWSRLYTVTYGLPYMPYHSHGATMHYTPLFHYIIIAKMTPVGTTNMKMGRKLREGILCSLASYWGSEQWVRPSLKAQTAYIPGAQ